MTPPPVLAGAVKLTVACDGPGVMVPIMGAPANVTGITGVILAADAPVPLAFVAVTAKVYAIPFVNPFTVI
jgi:hypothetical protein